MTRAQGTFSREGIVSVAKVHRECIDQQIQATIVAGDGRRTLELLARTYLETVFHYCCRMLNGDRVLAEDVTQQVFEEACKGIAEFREESSVKTWLLAIAHNLALREVQRRGRRARLLDTHAAEVTTRVHTAPAPELESEVLSQEWLGRLQWALGQLEPAARSILLLRFGGERREELPTAEIAQILGVSRATTYRRLQEALAQLKRMMLHGGG